MYRTKHCESPDPHPLRKQNKTTKRLVRRRRIVLDSKNFSWNGQKRHTLASPKSLVAFRLANCLHLCRVRTVGGPVNQIICSRALDSMGVDLDPSGFASGLARFAAWEAERGEPSGGRLPVLLSIRWFLLFKMMDGAR